MRGSKLILYKGMVFGDWTLIEEVEQEKLGNVKWSCRCSCGKVKNVSSSRLTCGRTTSCGCKRIIQVTELLTTHGQTKGKPTPEFTAWDNMKRRCSDPYYNGFEHYGGRGISVCERWINSFENFFTDMGKRPSPKHSLDRWPNMNGNYQPDNCRWATPKEQADNRRNAVIFEHNGISKTQSDWTNYFNISVSIIHRHIKQGKTFEWIYNRYSNCSKSIKTK